MAVIALVVPAVQRSSHVALLDIFNDVGTCAAFGFIVAYTLITVAAPAYLKRLGELRTRHWVGCGASLLLLTIPAVGSVYPIPAAPVSYFPYVFLLYLASASSGSSPSTVVKPSASQPDPRGPRRDARALPGDRRRRSRRISDDLAPRVPAAQVRYYDSYDKRGPLVPARVIRRMPGRLVCGHREMCRKMISSSVKR